MRIPHISTGDLLRDHVSRGTDLGRKVQDVMNRGDLVSDSLVLEMLRDRLLNPDCVAGFVLDGFPRSRRQAEMLDECLSTAYNDGALTKTVFRLVISASAVIQRLSGRRTCPQCAKTFSSAANSVCDVDGSPLVSRIDDSEGTVRNRLRVFEEMISGIITYYEESGSVLEISADHSVEKVTNNLLYELERTQSERVAGV
jgi:adenylate kinase